MLSACDHKANGADLLIAGLPTVTGIGATFLRGFAEYNERMTSAGNFPGRRDLWDAANVTRVFSCEPLSVPALTLVGEGPPFMMYRNDTAWPRAIWTCGLERLTEWEVAERLREGHYENRRLIRDDRVNIRWKPTVSESARHARERQYGLADAENRDGTTWRYRMTDTSRSNVEALLDDSAVDDTHGIDRERAQLAPPADGASRNRNQMLFGTASCEGHGSVVVTTTDRADGLVRARVQSLTDGYVVLAEAYYPERQAFVDGKRAPAWRANLAFMSVAVPAGTHGLELRYVPTTFYAGLTITGVTLLAWCGGSVVRRRLGRAASHLTGPGHAAGQQ
jgi:hypothetical protein